MQKIISNFKTLGNIATLNFRGPVNEEFETLLKEGEHVEALQTLITDHSITDVQFVKMVEKRFGTPPPPLPLPCERTASEMDDLLIDSTEDDEFELYIQYLETDMNNENLSLTVAKTPPTGKKSVDYSVTLLKAIRKAYEVADWQFSLAKKIPGLKGSYTVGAYDVVFYIRDSGGAILGYFNLSHTKP